jgi:hypothetical protein
MKDDASGVDFGYAFAPPHRLTACTPEASDKTLLDAKPGSLRMTWSYDSLADKPYGPYVWPRTQWELELTPLVDDAPFASSAWRRVDGWLPALENTYRDGRGVVTLTAVGAADAAVMRVEVQNTGSVPHTLALRCVKPGGWAGINPAWADDRELGDALLAQWTDRADRVLVMAVGAARTPVVGMNALTMAWDLAPGESAVGWLVRPYLAYEQDLPALRNADWSVAYERALEAWRELVGRAPVFRIPDSCVLDGLKASLADLFVMREPAMGGHLTATPGTEVYRAGNCYEGSIMAVALDQLGYHDEADAGARVSLETQEPDGNWTEPRAWARYMWGGSGMKAWAVWTHYRLTCDRGYLEELYPRLLASSRWQEAQRERTRVAGEDAPPEAGLMPRGMGDAGLMNDDDLFGVFLPHNIWAVFADKVTLWAAEELDRPAEEVAEVRRIWQVARNALLRALDLGAIVEEGGYRWIPAVANKTSGSRWGALNALTPTGLLVVDDPLIEGTIRKMASRMSPGGLPVHTGWMEDGMWVAITLDNLAEAHLARGEGDEAAEYLYAVLNHGTPLYTWCEERGQPAGTDKTSGDLQHLWTPLAVVRYLRDAMVLEEGNGLHFGLGAHRRWWQGGPVGIGELPTAHGSVAWELALDRDAGVMRGWAEVNGSPAWIRLHVRLPECLRIRSIQEGPGELAEDGGSLLWHGAHGRTEWVLAVE